MGGLARRVGLGQSDDALADGGRERCNARRSGLVAQEAIHAFMHEPLLPAPQAGLALVCAPHDLVGAEAVCRQHHDLRSPHVFLRAVPVRHDRFKTSTIGGTHIDPDPCTHPADSHSREPLGIPRGTLPSEFDH